MENAQQFLKTKNKNVEELLCTIKLPKNGLMKGLNQKLPGQKY